MAKAAARTVAPYGLWASPISADLLTQAAISFGDVTVLPARGKAPARIAYVENRPFEQGRSALVSLAVPAATDGKVSEGTDLLTRAYSAQSSVHEYGGGAVAAAPGGESFVFTQAKTCGIFEARSGAEPRRLREDSKTSRLADFSAHPSLPLVLCVHEDHTVDTPAGVVNTIACLDTRDGALYTLVKGPDFSVSPRFSPCGRFVAWVSWDHPSMPWWGTQLWVARFLHQDGRPPVVSEARCVAGSPREVAQMPVWAPTKPDEDAALYFTDDETGYANLYEVRVRPEDEDNLRVSDKLALLKVPQQSDFQQPAWQLNGSSFVPLNEEWLACSMITRGIHSLALVHLPTRTLRPMETPFRVISQLRAVDEHRLVFVGTRFDEPSALVLMDVSGAKKGAAPKWQVLKRSSDVVQNGTVPRDYLSQAQTVEFPTTLPDGSKSTAHAIVYPPLNPHYAAPTGAAPPAIILAHGGPTSAADAGLNLGVQFWTTRGFLVCNVNYGGSTGYGRKYMERLNKNWGVVDVRDCAACADWLASGAGSGGPSPSADSSAARASRSSSEAGRAQLSLLSERRQPDGTIELTLLNEHAGWSLGAVDVATAALGSGLVAAVQQYRYGVVDFMPLFGVAVAGVLWLWRHLNQVQQETVTSIPDIGIQLTTVKGFAIPWVHARRARLRGPPKTTLPGSRVPTSVAAHFQATSLRTRLIPRDSILDVVTIEAFRRWGVMDYLAISTRAAEGYEGAGRGGKLEVMFPHLLPHLPVVERVYERLFDRPPPKEATGWDPVRMQKIAVEKQATGTPVAAPANVPRVDPSKIAIAGGSSGGYTVLAALCLYPDSFNAGRSSYGISELTALYRLSHKFESRYPTALLGGTPEEVPQVYHDRSPLYMADRIRAPVIFFQGAEDKVVPPAQSEEIVQAIRKQGGRVSYTLFEGEGHGFRQAAHQKAALEGELQWYIDVFKLGGSAKA